MRICPKHIMCAVDFSGFAPLILSYGKAMADEFESALTICHIVQDTVMLSSHAQAGFSTEEVTAQRIEDAEEAIGHLAEQEQIKADTLVSLSARGGGTAPKYGSCVAATAGLSSGSYHLR